MAKGDTRIRWTNDERNTVLEAYRTLHSREPGGDITTRFGLAQKTLPPKRRRTLDYTLRVWLKNEVAEAGRPPATIVSVAPGEFVRSRPIKKTSAGPEGSAKSGSISAAALPGEAHPRDRKRVTPSAALDSIALERLLVERGAEIVAEILESARVQQALRGLLRAAWPGAGSDAPVSTSVTNESASPTDDEAVGNAPLANGKLRILIAGMDKSEGALLAKTYDDTLALSCWSAEDGLERLRVAVDRADVVVGMAHALSQPVEQTLRRHSKRYLRNARGLAGLRGELAELVLSGPGGDGAEA